MVEGRASMWLKGALRRGWRGRFGVVGMGTSTGLKGGAWTWLEGAIQRDGSGRFDVVGGCA